MIHVLCISFLNTQHFKEICVQKNTHFGLVVTTSRLSFVTIFDRPHNAKLNFLSCILLSCELTSESCFFKATFGSMTPHMPCFLLVE